MKEWDYEKLKDKLGQYVTITIKGMITSLNWYPDGTATISTESGQEIKVPLYKLMEGNEIHE